MGQADSGGGALLYLGSAEILLTDVEFEDNVADSSGGAFWLFSKSGEALVTMSSGSILRNQADFVGGVYVYGSRLDSQDVDWGDGADDNEPDDLDKCEADFGVASSLVLDAFEDLYCE